MRCQGSEPDLHDRRSPARDSCVAGGRVPVASRTPGSRSRQALPLPLERVKSGGPGGRCFTSAWLLHRGSHPHPSPLPQGRGRTSGASQGEFDPGPSRVVAGVDVRTSLTGLDRGQPNPLLPLERVKSGGPGGRCSTSAWLLHRGSHPHPSPLPQGRGRTSGASQGEFDPGPSRVVAGVGARKTGGSGTRLYKCGGRGNAAGRWSGEGDAGEVRVVKRTWLVYTYCTQFAPGAAEW